jgi:hypothetical protein
MISDKRLETVSLEDIEALKANRVTEGKWIEYKAEIPNDNKKFLAAATSFANTEGGDLIYGVAEDNGVPIEMCGVEVSDEDKLKLRFESAFRDNVEPRARPLAFKLLHLASGRCVLVIRIQQSWNKPHRAWKDGPFYARNSAGKYQLDVGELRAAFTLAGTVTERVRNFRLDRLAKIGAGDTPVPLEEGCIMVLHLLPVSAFSSFPQTRITLDRHERFQFAPFESGAPCQLVNLDGYVIYSTNAGASLVYAQVFRSGAVEAAASFMPWQDIRQLDGRWIEKAVIRTAEASTKALAQKGVEPPFLVSLAFVNITGYGFDGGGRFEEPKEPLRSSNLFLPEVLIEQPGFGAATELHPMFDAMWNAYGYEQSQGYRDGKWIPPRD